MMPPAGNQAEVCGHRRMGDLRSACPPDHLMALVASHLRHDCALPQETLYTLTTNGTALFSGSEKTGLLTGFSHAYLK